MKAVGDRAVALTRAPALMGSLPCSHGLPYPFILVRVNKGAKEQEAFMNTCLMVPCLSAGTFLGVCLSMS